MSLENEHKYSGEGSGAQDASRETMGQTEDEGSRRRAGPDDDKKDGNNVEKSSKDSNKDLKEREEKDKAPPSDVCRDYLRNVCKRKKHCKFAHPPGLKGSEGKFSF